MADFELITRFSAGKTMPGDRDLVAAAHEVFVEDHPSLAEGDYAEHPNAWLSYGLANGDKWTTHTVYLSRDRTATYERFADQDDSEPEFTGSISELTEARAIRLWRLLAAKNLPELRAVTWRTNRDA